MKERSWTIGSSPDCDILVDSSTVSGRHCRLTQRGQVFLLEDLGSTNGTFVAAQRIDQPRNVRRGDNIRLGLSTPMPWPNLSSITIGRLPDNDVVIPLDMISGHHARLEREGSRVFLVDTDSKNGTSLNDPFNKINRAVIQPGDIVFLGTHKVSARDLFAALPEDISDSGNARQATRLESPMLAGMDVKLLPADPMGATASSLGIRLDSNRSARAWAMGIGLGAVCIVAVTAASIAMRASSKTESRILDPPEAEKAPPAIAKTPAVVPHRRPREIPRTTVPKPSRLVEPEFDEQLVHNSERGVYLLCARADRLICFTRLTAWAISPDTIVCSTNVLNKIESKLTKGDKLDQCIVACSPLQTLRIMKHSPVGGEGGFLSVGHLEVPAEAVSFESSAASAFVPVPGQKLALLVARGQATRDEPDNPATITRQLITLKVDQIQRDAQDTPLTLYCTAAEDPGPAIAAPVFDGAGRVIGCVESAIKTELHVVPISRLTTLLQTNP